MLDSTVTVLERAPGDWNADVDARVQYAVQLACDQGMLRPHQCVLIVTGYQPGAGSTNTLRAIRYLPAASTVPVTAKPEQHQEAQQEALPQAEAQ